MFEDGNEQERRNVHLQSMGTMLRAQEKRLSGTERPLKRAFCPLHWRPRLTAIIFNDGLISLEGRRYHSAQPPHGVNESSFSRKTRFP